MTEGKPERARPTNLTTVQLLGASTSWHEDGACYGDNDDSMYPEKEKDQRVVAQRCQLSCDVQTKCLSWAIENDERWGVWGGLTEKQREKLRKDAKRRAAQ